MPPLMIGIFDQHASAKNLSNYPQMYQLGQKKEFFNVRNFWGWTLNAFVHSIILYFLIKVVAENDLVTGSGMVGGHWFIGMIIYTAVLVTVILKAALITKYFFV